MTNRGKTPLKGENLEAYLLGDHGVRFNPAQMQSLVDAQARYKMIPASFDVRDVIYPPALRG